MLLRGLKAPDKYALLEWLMLGCARRRDAHKDRHPNFRRIQLIAGSRLTHLYESQHPDSNRGPTDYKLLSCRDLSCITHVLYCSMKSLANRMNTSDRGQFPLAHASTQRYHRLRRKWPTARPAVSARTTAVTGVRRSSGALTLAESNRLTTRRVFSGAGDAIASRLAPPTRKRQQPRLRQSGAI